MTVTTTHGLIGMVILMIIFVLCEAANVWFNANGIPDSTRPVNDKNRFREYNRKRTLSGR
jgi:hypothetical protein